MDGLQTIEEIKAEFPSEWVLIGEPRTDEWARLQGGRVLFHSPNRDDVYRKAVESRLPHFAVRYFGTMPENTALEAVVDEAGSVRLLGEVHVDAPRRAFVTILEEWAQMAGAATLLAEPALAVDWLRPEEDEAWSHLPPVRNQESGVIDGNRTSESF